jgi:hypothetical protein
MDEILKRRTILNYSYDSALAYQKVMKTIKDKARIDYEEYLLNTKTCNIHQLYALEQASNDIDKLYQDAIIKTNRAYESLIRLK